MTHTLVFPWLLRGPFLALDIPMVPDHLQEPVKLALVVFAAGIGAFLAARILVTPWKALFVAVVAVLFCGGASYLLFAPKAQKVAGIPKEVKEVAPAQAPRKAEAPAAPAHSTAPARPAPAKATPPPKSKGN
jgi:hypothetical protein